MIGCLQITKKVIERKGRRGEQGGGRKKEHLRFNSTISHSSSSLPCHLCVCMPAVRPMWYWTKCSACVQKFTRILTFFRILCLPTRRSSTKGVKRERERESRIYSIRGPDITSGTGKHCPKSDKVGLIESALRPQEHAWGAKNCRKKFHLATMWESNGSTWRRKTGSIKSLAAPSVRPSRGYQMTLPPFSSHSNPNHSHLLSRGRRGTGEKRALLTFCHARGRILNRGTTTKACQEHLFFVRSVAIWHRFLFCLFVNMENVKKPNMDRVKEKF